jgi:hypothetical protein
MAARQPADFRADYPVGATHRDASIILHRNYALADYGSSSGAVATTGIAVVVARGTKCRTAPVLILISLVRLSHPFPHRFLRYGDELVWASGINKPAPQVISSQCVLLAVHRERGERWSTADYGSGDQGMLKVAPSTRIIHLGRGQSIRQRERPTTSLPARMKSGSCRRSPLRTLSESFAGTNRDSWRDRSCPYASCLSRVRCGMPRPAIRLLARHQQRSFRSKHVAAQPDNQFTTGNAAYSISAYSSRCHDLGSEVRAAVGPRMGLLEL